MKTAVYNLKGEAVGEIDLSDAVFARPWNSDLVHQALVTQAANRRQPLAHTKGRGEVSGGGKKPWRQKHTGRARHGSIRSPLWRGGGVTHGPLKERVFAKKINKKMLKAALACVLSRRLQLSELKVVDSLDLTSHKTKELAGQLCGFLKTKVPNALLISPVGNTNLNRAARNLPKVKNITPNALNVEDLLKYKTILLDKRAATEIK